MDVARSLIATALWFIAMGVIFGIPGVAYLAVIPIGVLAFGLLIDPPGGIEVERRIGKTSLKVGEEFTVKVRVVASRGFGPVIVRERLPYEFVLVGGSNVRSFFKGLRKTVFEFEYRVKAMKRGSYSLGPLEVFAGHPFNLKPGRWGVYGEPTEVPVLPLVALPKRVRTPVTKSPLAIPLTSISMRGASSTDFKEIREYRPGDPVKFINWKASARGSRVLVNEFEREGKKTILFVMDPHGGLVGTSVENPMEYGIQLISSLAYYFAKRGYNVGLYVMGYGKLIMPSSGMRQLYTIVKTLLELEDVPPKEESFALAVGRLKSTILRYTPLIIYVGNVIPENLPSIEGGIRKLRGLYKLRRLPFLLFDVSVYQTIDRDAGLLVELKKRAIHRRLSGGVYVLPWNPAKEGVTSVVTKTVRLIR